MYFSDYQTAAAFIKERIGQRQPCVGIVLGSGLGALADAIEEPIVLPYKEIPNFPVSTAIGHKGNLICGTIAGHCVLAMQGRFHFYEGYTMQQVTFPMRVMKVMGIETLFVSNAAGGLNPGYKVGDLMMIKDHINMLPNPLIGKNMEEFGPRFPDMTIPYDPELRKLAKEIAARVGIDLKEGVYYGDTGPTYETPAEYKFKFIAGADAVGMSTVPEVIVARHCGMRVFGVSVISNEAHGDFSDDYVNDGDDVVEAANAASKNMIKLFTELIRTL